MDRYDDARCAVMESLFSNVRQQDAMHLLGRAAVGGSSADCARDTWKDGEAKGTDGLFCHDAEGRGVIKRTNG